MQFIGLSYGWIGVEFVRLVLCSLFLLLLWHLQELLITVSIDDCRSSSVDLAGLLKIQLFVCELSQWNIFV